mmetsp:Transcript_67569/g.206942  ORF Transcript_67569/g.206942 Transcript_67569/m.206942 type:complete len:205 (-) Transcript_67569:1285-1899(-)
MTGAPGRYCTKVFTSSVALISTSRRSGRRPRVSFKRISKKSVMRSRSWTSSRMMVLNFVRNGSVTTRRRSVPTVQYSIVPVSQSGNTVSPRTAWPISPPTSPKRSQATRCARDVAAMRRGCVTTMRGFIRIQAARPGRTRSLTTMSSSSSPPSKYRALIVFLSFDTSRTSHANHSSSASSPSSGSSWNSTSTVAPSSSSSSSSS